MCAFDMTKKNEGGGKSKFIPENIVAEKSQHYAVFSEYIELGKQEQKTKDYPDKKPAEMAVIGFELTDQTYIRKTKEGEVETAVVVNRTIPLYSSEKANAYKFFHAIGQAPTSAALKKIIDEGIEPKKQSSAPKIGKDAHTFVDMLDANVFLDISHGKSQRVFEGCYPPGTTAEEAKDGKVDTIDKQVIDWTWNNFTPASVTSTFHPRYGYEACTRAECSKGNRVFVFDEPTKEGWEALDRWMQDKIKGALNYEGSAVEALVLSLEKDGTDEAASNKMPTNSKDMDEVPF